MTREDIIRMAREAGCEETWGMDAFRFTIEELERFAALVAEAEREACARICDAYGMPDGTSETARILAAAIRGQK